MYMFSQAGELEIQAGELQIFLSSRPAKFAVRRVKSDTLHRNTEIKGYNYLLTGNKVLLYFTEINSRYFIARGEAEGNKSSRVNRGEIKALYCQSIRNFISIHYFINKSIVKLILFNRLYSLSLDDGKKSNIAVKKSQFFSRRQVNFNRKSLDDGKKSSSFFHSYNSFTVNKVMYQK